MPTCAELCSCDCLSINITAVSYVVDDTVYLPGSCALTLTAPLCCSPYTTPPTTEGRVATTDGEGQALLLKSGGGGDGSACLCAWTGIFTLYKDGDYNLASLDFSVVLRLHSNEFAYVEVSTAGETVMVGYSVNNWPCVIKCYVRTEPGPGEGPDPIFTPQYGPPSSNSVSATRKDDFEMTLAVVADVTQKNCQNWCIVQYVAPIGGHPVFKEENLGLCPVVREFTPDDWSTIPVAGIGCRYMEGSNCYGASRADTWYHYVLKYRQWPNIQTCQLDCCDLFQGEAYVQGAGFTEPSAWWVPDVSWELSPRGPCGRAFDEGSLVYMFTLDCVTYYQDVPAGVEPFMPDGITPNVDFPHPLFTFTIPCGAIGCKFYEDTSCGIAPPIVLQEMFPIGQSLLPGATLTGITEGNFMAVKTSVSQQKIDTYLAVEYPLCTGELVDTMCATCIDPKAPVVAYAVYTCQDCHPGCYDQDDVTPKPGLTSYSEVVYGIGAAGAIAAALARIGELKSSETDMVIPYATCYLKDTERVTPCDWGIHYASVVPSGDFPEYWEATIVMCFLCGQFVTEMCESLSKTDFYGHIPIVNSVGRSINPDGDLGYCLDFDTVATMVSGWVAYADEMYTQDCFGWLSLELNTTDPWNHAYDYGQVWGALGVPGATCHPSLLTSRPHRKERYPTGPVNILYPEAPTSSIRVTCDWNNVEQVWRWSGYYTECRWCDPLCTVGCEANPCLWAIGYEPYYNQDYGGWTLIGDPTKIMPDGCSLGEMNDLIALVGNRGWAIPYWDDAWLRKAQVVKCDPRLLSSGLHPYLAGCVVEYCTETCNLRPPPKAPPYDFLPQSYWGNACTCNGSYYAYWSTSEVQIVDLINGYLAAVTDCNANPMNIMTNVTWEPCEDCAAACVNTLISTDAADYVRVESEAYSPSGQLTEQPGDDWWGRNVYINPISAFPWNKLQITGSAWTESTKYKDPDTGIWSAVSTNSNVNAYAGGYACCINAAWSEPGSGAIPCVAV